MQNLATRFMRRGFGMVAMIGLEESDGEPLYRCFSTVSKEDMYAVLEVSSTKTAMMPVEDSLEEGCFVSKAGNELDAMAEEAVECLNYHSPMIVAIAGEGCASIFVVGEPPMLVYMAVRMMGVLKSQGGDPTMFRFFHSDN